MQLKQLIGEHTIDVDLLPEEPLVLDVGCRYFNFCEEIFALRPKARIIALDPAPDVGDTSDSRITFLRYALVQAEQEFVWLNLQNTNVSLNPQPGWVMVPAISVAEMICRYDHFDLIKLDCEGSEFPILENWSWPWATQINVEFHDNLISADGRGLPWSYFDSLFSGPLKDYRVLQNEPDRLGTHVDALLVLKGDKYGFGD